MTTPINIDNPIEIINKISAGLAASDITVIKQARFHNTPIISWDNGKIIKTDPFTIPIPEDNNKN